MLNERERLGAIYDRYERERASLWDPNNPGNRAILQERTRWLLRMLNAARFSLTHSKILDLGCGSGAELARLVDLGATPNNVHGADLLPSRIGEARQRYPQLRFDLVGEGTLPYPDCNFDLVFMFTLLSSVAEAPIRRNIAGQALRVLKPGGAIVCYDMRLKNPWNPNVWPVTRRQLPQIFAGGVIEISRTLTLLPPLARRAAWAYAMLAAIPWLRSHRLTLIRKPT